MRPYHSIKGDILIVDDLPDNLSLLSNSLTSRNHEVRAVLNGFTALSAIRTDPPDLILLDIKMPEMDGYELCRRLKTDTKTRHIPIVFLSALDEPLDKVKAFTIGGADYITKPFQTEEVLARVQNQLEIGFLQKRLTAKNEELLRSNQNLVQKQTDLGIMQERMLAQNEELFRSNQDLEQFAYVISHDLKQPLQSLLGFARLLNLKYQDCLDEQGEKYLACLADSALHMNALIEDVLAYSRIRNQPKMLEITDCNVVVQQVLTNVQAAIERSGALVAYEPLPTVMADTVQMVELFQNLINNAIKFCHPDTAPKITIAAEPGDREWRFEVRDNGIGINADAIEQIFQVFQRGHAQSDYPGTGIGLAICQKVVERHGGRIWVESEPGTGTSFYFTVPIADSRITGATSGTDVVN